MFVHSRPSAKTQKPCTSFLQSTLGLVFSFGLLLPLTCRLGCILIFTSDELFLLREFLSFLTA